MSCAFDKERLTGFFDGELGAAEKADVERHIAGCSECLRDLGEIKSAALLVKELPRVRAPRSIAEGVSREISSAGRGGSGESFRRRLFWAAAAAAGLLVAVNVLWFTTAVPERTPVAYAPSSKAAPALGASQAEADRAEPPPQELAKKVKQERAREPMNEPAPVMADESRKDDAAAEPFTLFSKGSADRSRERLAEALKAIGVVPPEAKDSPVALALTEEQMARLRVELEKGGEARLRAGAPAELMAAKSARAASGQAAPAKPAAPAPAEEKESRPQSRRIVIHIQEVTTLPD